ncbi:hypothetical protein PsorP6_018979 [Peronosclerospora sorghi]|nr:hypothetical protein PsorP6_019235 [Peronosclerospora sorghi]KAI9895526.1 hypothetical protein PsorP6_018979 [Peronosclerospora sorghi]
MPEKSHDTRKGVVNVARQTWDRAHYEKLAQLRADGQIEKEEKKKVIKSSKEEFQAAKEGAVGPAGSARAFLKARTTKISLESSVGTVKVVKADEVSKSSGYYCEVCECSLKDSMAYLDHINGKKHLRKLGYSMRVERSTVDQVKNRLQSASKRKWDSLMIKKLDALEGSLRAMRHRFLNVDSDESCTLNEIDYEKKLKAAADEEARVKRQRKEQKQATKRGKAVVDQDQCGNGNDHGSETKFEPADALSEADAEMRALMGFGGFGGSKKS